jgi:hypothetical protein
MILISLTATTIVMEIQFSIISVLRQQLEGQ